MPVCGVLPGDAVTVTTRLGDNVSTLEVGVGSLGIDFERSIAGGFFFMPVPAGGGRRVGMGAGCVGGGEGTDTSSARALKLRFLRTIGDAMTYGGEREKETE